MPASDEPKGTGSDPAQPVHELETVVQRVDSDLSGARHVGSDSPTPGGLAGLDEFTTALIEIGLLDAGELANYTTNPSEGVLGLSRALVKAGKLTPYQAAAIYQKKSRGLLIGNYLILDKLGQGGMGMVFKARHRRLGRVGALKILPPSFARDKDAVMRFRREVEAAGRLQHPNLVAAQDADEDRGVHFLVMDYVAGRDLDRVVGERGPLPVAQAIDCLIQAARGLETAHVQGIVHRDIKPANLMLDTAGTVRVLDLGLARIVDASNPFGKTATGRLTQSGMYMGTVDYMAPEQAEDSHRVDHRADIYSLGCTFYYLLTGQEPFVGETVLKRLMAHMEKPAPSLRIARPEVSPALDAAYLKMVAKRPEDRPASMAEVISLVEACKATAAEAPKSRPELKVFNETPLKRAGAPRTKVEASIFARPKEPEDLLLGHELSLEDLVMDVRPAAPPTPLPPAPRPAPVRPQPLKRAATARSRSRPKRRGLVLVALGASALLVAAFVRFVLFPGPAFDPEIPLAKAAIVPDPGRDSQLITDSPPPSTTPIPTGDALAGARSSAILARLDEPIFMAFPDKTPLGVVLRHFKNATSKGRNDPGVPVYLDPIGLQEAKRSLASTVTINGGQTPLKIALQQVLDQLGLAYVVRDDVLIISSRKGVDREQNETTAVLTKDALPMTKVVLAELEKPISMPFANDTPLQDLLKYIAQATKTKTFPGIPIFVDPKGLMEAERTLRSTFSIDLEGVPLKTTLRLLLKQLGLAYVVQDGRLLVVSSTRTSDRENKDLPAVVPPAVPKPVEAVVKDPERQWVLIGSNHHSGYISEEASRELDRLAKKGSVVKWLSFAPNGGWAILSDRAYYCCRNLPGDAFQQLKELGPRGEEIKSITFAPNGAWTILYGRNRFSSSPNMPDDVVKALNDARMRGEELKSIAFAPGGGCVVLSGQNRVFVRGQIPETGLRQIETYKKERKDMKSITFTPDSGWAILFGYNGAWWGPNVKDEPIKALKDFSHGEFRCLSFAVPHPLPPSQDGSKPQISALTGGKPLASGSVSTDIVFEDFEKGYANWREEGKAFGQGPAKGTLAGQQPVSGFEGKGLVNSFFGGDKATGRLISKPFTIERNLIRFLIGGGVRTTTQLRLVIDGKTVRAENGRDNERLQPAFWNVSEFRGNSAHLEIVDEERGRWGHINVDQIEFSDRIGDHATD